MKIFSQLIILPGEKFSSMCESSYIEQSVEVCVMALLRYFQVTPHRRPSGDLPDPAGPLLLLLPSSAIEEANVAVASIRIQEEESSKSKRGPHLKLSDEIRAKIGKYSCENGDSAAARHFTEVLGKPINCSTVCGLKKTYLQELSHQRKAEKD